MLEATFDEVVDKYHTHDKEEHITETHTISAETETELFEKTYPFQRSLRYCNGYSIRFRDPALQTKWKEWLKTGVTMQMYYGNATVD